ncbi:phosphoglycerate mutase [Ramlibacter tataouinensis]|uniref:phosphoglycerate mutase n=1 Tax=Ramlibacter tataouinensis TaxID=94132 RepID=UPI0022F3EC45|nr:phosphoglycerate mutase [Ramlibacter tataouinensis]WBY03474.1 phosphoglycerate mutase [Ramlibacter tataouinensis]
MSDAVHLLIPFAACSADGCRERLASLRLPNLERLLAAMAPAQQVAGDEHTLSMPHERVLARECGLQAPDGLLPFAAWEAMQAGIDPAGQAWAWVTPCHWRVGTDHVFMHHPQELALDAQESQALLAALRPYFEQDGLQLAYEAPTRWLASGPLFAQVPCASLDRVVGRVIDAWMPRGEAGKPLRRLQQEMQMLLYTHPVNEERSRGGQLPVNSFWVSGNGVLPPGHAPEPPPELRITHYLRDAALRQDWAAWAAGWQQIDEGEGAWLLQAAGAGQSVAVSLCGDRQARTWRSAGGGWRRRLAAAFSRQRAVDWLAEL